MRYSPIMGTYKGIREKFRVALWEIYCATGLGMLMLKFILSVMRILT